MGTTNFYAGRLRKALLPAQCDALATSMAQAKAYAQQYPTRASAEAAGWKVTFEYFSGMGTHHGQQMFTEEVLNSPSFNRHDPILPGTTTFDPTKPNTLQYDNDGPNAELVGMSWYIRSTTGPPPASRAASTGGTTTPVSASARSTRRSSGSTPTTSRAPR
jgi:hypothetical protein